MATETLRFDLLANDRASRVFNNVGDSSSKLHQTLGKVGSGMVVLGKMAAAGATAVGALGAAGAVMGLKVAASNEQAMISFTTMLGSAKKAGAFLKQLQEFAAKTPFEFPELQTAASSLISAGFQAKKVIPIMTTLGDVTSGMGTGAEGVQRATVALQQMSAAGRITGEDLNQLRDAGVPVFDLLSAATGKSKAAISALAQEGKLGKEEMKALFKALETGNGLERFTGLMEKQAQSLTGLWSTFKDTLGQGLANAITPLIPLLKDGLGRASEFLGDALARIPGIIAAITGYMGDFKSGLAGARDNMEGFRGVAQRAGEVTLRFGILMRDEVIPRVAAFAGFVRNDLAPALAQFATVVLPAARAALASIARSLGDLLGTFSDGKGDARSFGNAVTTAITVAGPLVAAGLKVMALNVKVLVEAFQAATAPIRFFAQTVVNAVEGVRNAFSGADGIGLQFGRNLALGMIRGIAGMAGSVMSAAGDLAARAVAAIRDKLKIFSPSRVTFELGQFFSEGFAGGITKGAKVAIEATSDLIEKVKSKLSDLRSQAASIRSGARDAVLGSFDFGGIGATSTDADGNTTTASPVAQFADFAAKSAAFADAVSRGVGNGLDPRIVAQAVGTGNLSVVQSLAALDPASTGAVNRDFALAQKMAAQVGQTVLTTTAVPEQIAREEERLRVMREIRDDLRNNPREIRFVINDATDPDKVVAAIRRYIKRNGLLRDVAAP